MDCIESASVGCKMWWCLSSPLHRQLQWGCLLRNEQNTEQNSFMHCPHYQQVWTCAQSSLRRKQKEQSQWAFLFSALISGTLPTKLVLLFSDDLVSSYVAIKYFYCRAVSLKNVLFAIFCVGPLKVMTLNHKITGIPQRNSEAFAEGPSIQV